MIKIVLLFKLKL